MAVMTDRAWQGMATEETSQGDLDRAAVEAFRAGDRRAFEALVRRHQGVVWAVVRRFVDDRDEAEDLAQRAFVQSMEHIDSLRGAYRPWLLRTASNLAKNHRRDRAKFADVELPDVGHSPAWDERLDLERQRRRVRTALDKLGDRQREVLQLRVDGELAFAEVAEALGITENNAKVTYHHAVQRLRQLLGGDDDQA